MTTPGERLRDQLGDFGPAADDLELRLDEPMSKHTTLRLGGPADLWARPRTPEALSQLLKRLHEVGAPVSFVGAGTNLLVRDGGILGAVVNIGRLNDVSRTDSSRIAVQAGCSTGRLLKAATQWELGGVEFLGGVPGSVGGGLIMNAGTYLGEFTDVVTQVHSLRLDGSAVTRTHDECGFRYRDSDLPRSEIVVGCTLELTPRSRAEIEADVRSLRTRRDEREPKGVPNNGSTFKNPEGDYAGRLIEISELKGTRRGGAVVSEKHANWLVVDREQEPSCRSADMLELIEHVRAEVARKQGVELQLEVKVVGIDPR
jgi:UDP-N-acetylmuramate dehydrogenase